MANSMYTNNQTANEVISKYKLLSAYGAPGSIVHTQYGSIIISCIEEWGFLIRVQDIHEEIIQKGRTPDNKMFTEVSDDARLERNGNIGISNDERLLASLITRKELPNLKYLVLIPDIEIIAHSNKIKSGVELAIPSTFMPKVFSTHDNIFNSYSKWYQDWVRRKDNNGNLIDQIGKFFHPPKYDYFDSVEKEWVRTLKQDNIILLCEHGHISDFPWSKFLRWRSDEPLGMLNSSIVQLFEFQDCCINPKIKITSNSGNASGFDGKWLKCTNCNTGVSLKGIMGVKIKCPGHKPWEETTGNNSYYSGNNNARVNNPPSERCKCTSKPDGKGTHIPMKVALTTGNNIYYSRIFSSIYLHMELFESDDTLKILKLKEELTLAMNANNFQKCQIISDEIKSIEAKQNDVSSEEASDTESEIVYRYNEFQAFHKEESLLKKYPKDLNVKVVSQNLDSTTAVYFDRVLRLDNMKITSAQLDFSRVVPIDADSEFAHPKNIFRSKNENVVVYPVVENFGEGIFFSFRTDLIDKFIDNNEIVENLQNHLAALQRRTNSFNRGAVNYANTVNWQMYLVHTFSHLIMRELEFRCGYPTASLSERIYVSNDLSNKMYGCLIYTAEGAEGSMGGVIAQTRPDNLNNLIKSAINRGTICNSDPLCWESEGQGLFDLNMASCFSCSLVSETSCEHRNLYLDRKILVDEKVGFFKDLIEWG